MKKLMLACILSGIALATVTGAAGARDHKLDGPYWFEKVCDSDWNCSPHMRYAPGQSPAARPTYADYWYSPPSNLHFRCHLGHKRFTVSADGANSCPPHHLWWW